MKNFAQIIKQAGQVIGIDIKLHVDNQSTYYKDHWLSGTMSLVDYGHRGVPNVVLTATLTKDGAWNAAHFDNPEYDELVAQYVAALDLDTQRQIAGQIETLLLDETPYIVAYYFDSISVSKKSIGGVVTTGMGQIYLERRRTDHRLSNHQEPAAGSPRRLGLRGRDGGLHPQAHRACPHHPLDSFHDRLLGRPATPGRSRPDDSGEPCDGGGRCGAGSRAGRGSAGGHPVHRLDGQPRARRHGRLLLLPSPDPAVHHELRSRTRSSSRWSRS